MPNTESEFEKLLPIEQLSLLYKQSFSAFAATIAVLFYIIYKLPESIDQFWLNIWVISILIINLYLVIWMYLVRHTTITTLNAKRFIFSYQMEAVLHGLSWGMLPFLLSSIDSPDMKFFAYIVLCGMAAGAIGTTGMIYRIYLSFMLPMMLPAIATQMFFGDIVKLFGYTTLEFLIIFVVSLIVLAHTHYDSIKRSITLMIENKELLADATDAFNKAEAASHAKSQFLAHMSHELRTPLNAVIGYSELIADQANEHHIQSIFQDAGKINLAGKHLLSLINNVLDLSKIESGKMDIYIETISANDLINGVISTTEPLIKTNRNKLIFNAAENLGSIQSDYTKLRQILFNIIGNAAKFTSDGTITINALHHQDRLHISIIDTGIGMTKEQLIDITSPFVQADTSTTRKYGGTGLGLSLTEHLVKMLGIEFNITSAPGKGSSFTLCIPLEYKANKAQKKGAG